MMAEPGLVEQQKPVAMRRPFDPQAHDLDVNFRLTRFADLKGWGCKVPQDALLKLLEGLKDQGSSAQEAEQAHFQYMTAAPRIGEYGFDWARAGSGAPMLSLPH